MSLPWGGVGPFTRTCLILSGTPVVFALPEVSPLGLMKDPAGVFSRESKGLCDFLQHPVLFRVESTVREGDQATPGEDSLAFGVGENDPQPLGQRSDLIGATCQSSRNSAIRSGSIGIEVMVWIRRLMISAMTRKSASRTRSPVSAEV